jgi:hypothetical protein
MMACLLVASLGCSSEPGPACAAYVACCGALSGPGREAVLDEGRCMVDSESVFVEADEASCLMEQLRLGPVVQQAGGVLPAACN